ncbi:MAG TPA: UbiA family prenyltransferase [Chloroflexota bacterium]|nr:UbiA family prenyltransferase [Chloroflexota bacterium]
MPRTLLVHLRLHFQLLLAPVYLWGWLIAGGGTAAPVLVGFVSFHAFLYSGATAFNSYYDRDVGPVGGLEHPPSVVQALLPFSLAVQAFGWLLAAFVNAWFFVLYGLFVGLSVAYSHPRIRLKAHPVASLVVVGFGQGALAFCGAWTATRGDLTSVFTPDGVRGALAAMLLILALYPLSQLYQTDEDAARGDRTLAVVWGPARCFAFALAATALGGSLMVSVIASRFGLVDAVVVGAGLLAQMVLLGLWARRHDPDDILGTYRRVMRLNTASAGALGAYLLLRLAIDSR